MLKQVELTNFRQHKSLTLNFEGGVIALRGANESGKTTILEAIAYAKFGATALRPGETLASTVTRGEKESSLKVIEVSEINGVTYTTKRSKSGAEISDGTRILATGQTEVKRYWETLLGASAEVARNLMLADQQALRGALSEGPGAAVKLIEKLANFSLIESIVNLVQTKLPTGSTVAVEARITQLDAAIAQPVADDTGPLVQGVNQAALDLAAAEDALAAVRVDYDAVQEPARAAQAKVDAFEAAQREAATAESRLRQAETTLAAIVPVPGPSDEQLANLRKQVQDESQLAQAAQVEAALVILPEPDHEWEGDYASFEKAWIEEQGRLREISSVIADANMTRAKHRAMLITETACGLCGKDLSKVPEVVEKNATTQAVIFAAEEQLTAAQEAKRECEEALGAYQGIQNAHNAAQRVYRQAASFIALDEGYVPARWTWTGPELGADRTDSTKTLREAEAKASAYQRDTGRREQAQLALTTARSALDQACVARDLAQVPLDEARAVLAKAAEHTSAMFEAQREVETARQGLQTARQALDAAQAVLAERQRSHDALKAQLEVAKKELASIHFNNDLLKRLRDARPEIANELWSIVSSSVSAYFSDIRGTPSVFTRTDDGFKVDGYPASGLSGSALDSLGLAVRIALTRTFLPGNRFLVLDEASAACDDARTARMAGVVASAGFDQVIWVTHDSIIADFATQRFDL